MLNKVNNLPAPKVANTHVERKFRGLFAGGDGADFVKVCALRPCTPGAHHPVGQFKPEPK